MILTTNNQRSKHYLRALNSNNYQPNFNVIMFDSSLRGPGQRDDDDIQDLLKLTENIEYKIIKTLNVNSDELYYALKDRPEKYVIYAGPGGQILRKRILSINKQFLHIHPGKLPEYRGSTTIYYQILDQRKVGVSAIFFSLELDGGPIIRIEYFDLPNIKEDLDYTFDPRIRSETLIRNIDSFLEKGSFEILYQKKEEGEKFYIDNPVLIHIVKLKSLRQKESLD